MEAYRVEKIEEGENLDDALNHMWDIGWMVVSVVHQMKQAPANDHYTVVFINRALTNHPFKVGQGSDETASRLKPEF